MLIVLEHAYVNEGEGAGGPSFPTTNLWTSILEEYKIRKKI